MHLDERLVFVFDFGREERANNNQKQNTVTSQCEAGRYPGDEAEKRSNVVLTSLSRQSCYCFEALDRPDRLETALFRNRGTT